MPATFVDSAQRAGKGWKSTDQNKDAHQQQPLIISDSIVPFGDGGDRSSNHLNEELALDPDVPVVQDDDDEDDEEGDDGDIERDSDGQVA